MILEIWTGISFPSKNRVEIFIFSRKDVEKKIISLGKSLDDRSEEKILTRWNIFSHSRRN